MAASGAGANTTTAADTGRREAAPHHSTAVVGGEESKIGNAERVRQKCLKNGIIQGEDGSWVILVKNTEE